MKLVPQYGLNKNVGLWALRRFYVPAEALTNIANSQSCNWIHCIKLGTYLWTYFSALHRRYYCQYYSPNSSYYIGSEYKSTASAIRR